MNHCVFLPGTLCDERIFAYQYEMFPEHTIIDLRHSSSMEEMVNKVADVSADKFVLIGFSMGGHVAQEFSLKFPERIEKLVVIGASSEGYPLDEKKLVLSTLPLIEKGTFRGITDKRLKDYLAPTSYEKPELKKLIQDMGGPDAKEVYLRQIKATIDRRDLTSELRSLSTPVLFVGGVEDKIVSIESIERSAKYPLNSQFVAFQDCGHFIPLERPEKLNQILRDFL